MATVEFLQTLQDHDLIRVNGRLRVIRKVKWRHCKGYTPTAYFIFAILRCSWTGRPTTVIKSTDLYRCRVELVARNYKGKHSLDPLLDAEAQQRGSPPRMRCCDVVGVIT